MSKVHVTTTAESQIPPPFALQLAISNILSIFHFPIGHKEKFGSFLISLNFKTPKTRFLRKGIFTNDESPRHDNSSALYRNPRFRLCCGQLIK